MSGVEDGDYTRGRREHVQSMKQHARPGGAGAILAPLEEAGGEMEKK